MDYKCNRCNKVFNECELRSVNTTYESYYGVAHLFPNSSPYTYYVCPSCGSEDYDDYEDEDEEEDL